MIERFNDSNKIVTNSDLAGDDRILTDIMFTYPGSVKAIHSRDLVQNVKNAYNSDDNVDKQKLLMGSEISVAVPRIVKIQCSMPKTIGNASYTHARAVNARLSITWPNGGTTTLPIPSTWVAGYSDGFITTFFDFLTTAELCDGCQVKIIRGIAQGPAYVELATDANGSGATIPTTNIVTSQSETISSDMNAVALFTSSMGSGDIVITPKRQITVELRCSGAYYHSVEIAAQPGWDAGSRAGQISFGTSYSNVQPGQLLSTYTINLNDGNYNVLFSSLRATTKASPYASESNKFINPSPGKIQITEGGVTADKVIYDLGSPVLG
jgi:hypothetical protein